MSAAASGTSKAAHGDVAAKRKKGPGALATAYLVIYNVVMTAGYVACFLVLMLLVIFYDHFSLLQILHCAVGIVPSSVVLTGFQVMSRVFLTWAVTHSVREVHSPPPLPVFPQLYFHMIRQRKKVLGHIEDYGKVE
ncbi:very-long-chain (3R)-3-hydroxyacyl-CoA dehydratase 2 [Neolamprologus brichardi]|uniref:very-long-chain (3R)-3-hydroxyacyl-CoA dehydratase 2 n=1 Tax=Neolamprologus brichardi TaxID=32507 RepID=UPI001643968D|nr:very-long-chain (3R)-3-hydroxyacyl-CoA dehydratase 2 [Neolamprologus brichardi]